MKRSLCRVALLVIVASAGLSTVVSASFTNMPKTVPDNKWFWYRGSSYDYNYTDSVAVCASNGLKLAYMDSRADFVDIFKLFCAPNL